MVTVTNSVQHFANFNILITFDSHWDHFGDLAKEMLTYLIMMVIGTNLVPHLTVLYRIVKVL